MLGMVIWAFGDEGVEEPKYEAAVPLGSPYMVTMVLRRRNSRNSTLQYADVEITKIFWVKAQDIGAQVKRDRCLHQEERDSCNGSYRRASFQRQRACRRC